jgi:translation initiation factor eIF-2B subunit gamma
METKTEMEAEFQAIIMSGYGNSLYPLTMESSVPKGLLPVQNKPLIYHSLQWIEKTNISNVLIAVYPDAKQKISSFTEQYETNLEITVQEVKEGCGSAEALRQLKPFIKTDFIVISCDLITDVPPHLLLNAHRTQNNTMTCLLYDSGCLEPQERANKDDGEIIALHEESSQLLMVASTGDLKTGDQISLRASLLSKFPNVKFHSRLRDAHLYIFKRWILELLVKSPHLTSIKYDLIPLLLEAQHRKAIVKREGIEGSLL